MLIKGTIQKGENNLKCIHTNCHTQFLKTNTTRHKQTDLNTDEFILAIND